MLKENYKCGSVKIMNCHSFFLCLFTCLTLIGVSPTNLQANDESIPCVVWSGQGGSDGGSDRELFFWNGTTIQQVTENGGSDLYSRISGSNVVSFQKGGSDAGPDPEIFFWDGSSLQQITENNDYDISPQISGNTVVWESRSAGDHEIFLWERTTNEIQQITDNNYNDYSPQVSGSNVVWYGIPDDDPEIFFFNGSSIQQITDNNYNDYDPQISSNNIVWWRDKYKCDRKCKKNKCRHKCKPTKRICEFIEIEVDAEILFWNGTTNRTQKISTINDDYRNFGPQISGTHVVWFGQGGSDEGDDFEIFFWDGEEVIQITQNNSTDIRPQISGNNVVWEGRGGSDGGDDFEIFFWDKATKQTEQLTENEYNDVFPHILGKNIVWEGRGGDDEGDDSEIFFWDGTSIQQITENDINDGRPQISLQ